uniref:Uncharacterized protein n=1 Tax=Nelumbo nucifera TaxID=4432 RepID=A0A822YR44_NELNU|nr:TPA_asm: hypothetical protein HUJ06_012710 [Nelumbo nucifera]
MESWESVTDNVEFEGMDVSEIDETLLKSLLEEAQVEETEDERLGCVIRSLEAEIDPNMMDGCGVTKPELGGHGNCEEDMGVGDGHNCSSGSCPSQQIINEFDWIDMDMGPSTPSDDMGNWYMDSCAGEMVELVEFGEVISDYSQFYFGVPLDQEHAYSSLWQESYDSVIF